MDGKAPDPWDKAYVYGRAWSNAKTAHILEPPYFYSQTSWWGAFCNERVRYLNHTPDPYPVCKSCLRTKRAKELGLA